MVAPGVWTQYLTTREPKPEVVAVAVAALRGVMEKEGTLPPDPAEEPVLA